MPRGLRRTQMSRAVTSNAIGMEAGHTLYQTDFAGLSPREIAARWLTACPVVGRPTPAPGGKCEGVVTCRSPVRSQKLTDDTKDRKWADAQFKKIERGHRRRPGPTSKRAQPDPPHLCSARLAVL
jgi:hypothetical protein